MNHLRKSLILTTICIFVAFCLPTNLAKTKETGIQNKPVSQIKALQAVSITQKEEVAEIVPTPVVAPPVASAPINGCGDNEWANYIYMHESGCRVDAVNSIGCRGIGQRCGDLPCGADYACQNAWFSNYAISRYGSWYNAYLFWVSAHWW